MLGEGKYCLQCHAPNPVEERDGEHTVFSCKSCGAREARLFIVDNKIKSEETVRGVKHWTVGALIERDGKYLLMHKNTWPYLWDIVAGHLDVDEDPVVAVKREIFEETGLTLINPKLVLQKEIFPDPCRRGVNIHEWYVYHATAEGNFNPDVREVKELRWVSVPEMYNLPFVRPAYYIFDHINFWDKKRTSV